MFLITGLGNPGKEYEYTPHNAGFIFIDQLKETLSNKIQVTDWTDESRVLLSEISRVKIDGETVGILQKPLTYMNLSGNAVKKIMDKFNIQQYILIHDDLDIKLGTYKIQEDKSPKGHNGIKSIEQALGYTNFLRVRIGVENRNNRNIPGEEYVLQKYSKEEYQLLLETIQDAIKELVNLININ